MTTPRIGEFVKGALTVGPLFLGLVALATTLVLLTSTIGVDAKWPPWVVLFALGGVLAATGAIAARYWHRQEHRAHSEPSRIFVLTCFCGAPRADAHVVSWRGRPVASSRSARRSRVE